MIRVQDKDQIHRVHDFGLAYVLLMRQ